MQEILTASEQYSELDSYFLRIGAEKILLVCDSSMQFLKLDTYFKNLEERLKVKVIRFSNFQPNPLYKSVVEGVSVFQENECSAIVAVGGGSAIDVAKCIKLYSNMNHDINYLKQATIPNLIPFLAVPTTAGTGSEATRYAVIYYDGEKQSVTDESCIPSTVLFDASVLNTLPLYQKKATMMDAFCHAIESFWSVNSTQESRKYSKQAVQMILESMDGYLENIADSNAKMLSAANIAGKAINITQTTAGHAMCYKLTSLYGIAHGHAAALCVSVLFPYMLKNANKCIDGRGEEYLMSVFQEIAEAMNCKTPQEAADKFSKIISDLELSAPSVHTAEEIVILRNSVNPVRLKNHPVMLDRDTIEQLYQKLLNVK